MGTWWNCSGSRHRQYGWKDSFSYWTGPASLTWGREETTPSSCGCHSWPFETLGLDTVGGFAPWFSMVKFTLRKRCNWTKDPHLVWISTAVLAWGFGPLILLRLLFKETNKNDDNQKGKRNPENTVLLWNVFQVSQEASLPTSLSTPPYAQMHPGSSSLVSFCHCWWVLFIPLSGVYFMGNHLLQTRMLSCKVGTMPFGSQTYRGLWFGSVPLFSYVVCLSIWTPWHQNLNANYYFCK